MAGFVVISRLTFSVFRHESRSRNHLIVFLPPGFVVVYSQRNRAATVMERVFLILKLKQYLYGVF
jgi:hypothetical protein